MATYLEPAEALRYDGARNLPEQSMAIWMDAVLAGVGQTSIGSILDLGCGTGRFSLPLARTFDAEVVGIDPSEAMISVARQHEDASLDWKVGSAEQIPLDDASVDMAFISQAYHHLADKSGALREVRRVLRPGGVFVVRNATFESTRDIIWMKCFPEGAAIDAGRMPPSADLIAEVASAGFEPLSSDLVSTIFAMNGEEYFEKIVKRGLSALIQISDEAFRAGQDRLRQYVATMPPDEPIHEKVSIFFFRRID